MPSREIVWWGNTQRRKRRILPEFYGQGCRKDHREETTSEMMAGRSVDICQEGDLLKCSRPLRVEHMWEKARTVMPPRLWALISRWMMVKLFNMANGRGRGSIIFITRIHNTREKSPWQCWAFGWWPFLCPPASHHSQAKQERSWFQPGNIQCWVIGGHTSGQAKGGQGKDQKT